MSETLKPCACIEDPSAFPRRQRIDMMTPAERFIYNAQYEVELIGCDERLTDAVIKLKEARDLVADYVDDQIKKWEL